MIPVILQNRLIRQHIGQPYSGVMQELVSYMGAVQAQDYGAARWAIGLRMPGTSAAAVDAALADASLIRTHVLRPTWHFIAPQDAHWMLQLSARRINMACATYNKKLELDTKMFNKCNRLFEKTLAGKQLTRQALAAVLNKAGIATDTLRMVHILMRAEIDCVICSGGREGKQFTYALLDERTDKIKRHTPADSAAELAMRYFTSHGPATTDDFAWWSGLTLTEARRGIDANGKGIVQEVKGDRVLLYAGDSKGKSKIPKVHLLPAYDEYTVAYKDRGDILAAHHAEVARNGIFSPVILIDGKIAGLWQRTVKKSGVEVSYQLFDQHEAKVVREIQKVIDAYSAFALED